MFDPSHFDILLNLLALMVAYLLLVPVALNRERDERSADIHAFPLIAVASVGSWRRGGCRRIPMRRGDRAGPDYRNGLHRRRAILKTQAIVRSTATAAALWVTGMIGISVGLAQLDVAVGLSLVTALTLWMFAGKDDEPGEAAVTGEPAVKAPSAAAIASPDQSPEAPYRSGQ